MTELPLHDGDGRYLLVETDARAHTAVLSLPALGGIRMQSRARGAVRELLTGMVDDATRAETRVALPRVGGRLRLLLGMVLANRPWLLVPGLTSALVAALATGAIATINSTVWLLASSLSWWRLTVAAITSIALVVGWLVIDGGLWDRQDDDSARARERSRLYNASTLVTPSLGVVICYLALYVVNLAWALFILDPRVMGRSLQTSVGCHDVLVLVWFVASAATVGGALGTGLESDEAIRVRRTPSARKSAATGLPTTRPEPGRPHRRLDAAHRMQTVAVGLASRRASPITPPHTSQVPYVPASSLAMATPTSAR